MSPARRGFLVRLPRPPARTGAPAPTPTQAPGPGATPYATAATEHTISPSMTTPEVAVSIGGGHTCELRSNGSVACWGSNSHGQATPPAGSFIDVSTGRAHSCGVRTNGSVSCWGDHIAAQDSPPSGTFVSVSAGSEHTCGVTTGNGGVCWGSGVSRRDRPVSLGGSITSISAGGSRNTLHICFVRTDGSVACRWERQLWPIHPACRSRPLGHRQCWSLTQLRREDRRLRRVLGP